MFYRKWKFRALVALCVALAIFFHNFNPARAGFLGDTFKKYVPTVLQKPVQDEIDKKVYGKLAELLKMEAPIVFDNAKAFPKAKVKDFHPTVISLDNLNTMRLPPGDYRITNAKAQCAWHQAAAPRRGMAYRLASLQGKNADILSMLMFRQMRSPQINDAPMQAVTWNISSGVPFSRWGKTQQDYVRALTPEYVGLLEQSGLAGFRQKYEEIRRSASSYHLPMQLPALDSVLTKLGALGETYKTMETMEQQLQSNSTLSPETLIRQTFGANGLAAITQEEESPFVQVSPGVFERVTVTNGYDALNDLDVRITPEALSSGSHAKSGEKLAIAGADDALEFWAAGLLFTAIVGTASHNASKHYSYPGTYPEVEQQIKSGQRTGVMAVPMAQANTQPLTFWVKTKADKPAIGLPRKTSGGDEAQEEECRAPQPDKDPYTGRKKPKYTVADYHASGQGGRLRPNKTPLPKDAKKAYENSISDEKGKNWWAESLDGKYYYRYSDSQNDTAHFSESIAIDAVLKNTETLSKKIRKRLGCKK